MRALGWGLAAGLLSMCSSPPVLPSPDGGTGGGSGGSGGSCSAGCGASRECCNGTCVNTNNDPQNCGACGVKCTGATSFCSGTCTAPECDQDAGACGPGTTCCGTSCCGAGEDCCLVEGPVSGGPPQCHPKDAGTCPQGCAPLCASDRALKRDVLEQVSSMRFVVEAGHLQSSADPVDVHGTTLAAIQALHAALREQAARLDRLEAESRRLKAEVCAP